MSTSPSHRRTSMLGAVLLALALTVSACGGDDAKASDKPSPTTSTSASPTPSPTPTASPSQAPQSPFEDRPQVQALRGWADAVVRDVNDRKRDLPSAQEFQVDNDKVRQDVQATFEEEYDKYYPGPVPFTPVAVTGSGRRATVTTCVVSAGFALKKPGGQPAEKRKVIPIVFSMAKQQGTWLVAGILLGTADCGGVGIEELTW